MPEYTYPLRVNAHVTAFFFTLFDIQLDVADIIFISYSLSVMLFSCSWRCYNHIVDRGPFGPFSSHPIPFVFCSIFFIYTNLKRIMNDLALQCC